MPRTPLLVLLAALPALPTAAQPPELLPELLAPNVPPADWECAVLPESLASPHRVAAATMDLPPRRTCKGRCQVDIAFVYAPEVIGQRTDGNWPQSPGELEKLLRGVVKSVTGIWLASGLDAEPRFVGMEADKRLNGLTTREAIDVEGYGPIREKYGADLVYASPSGPGYHGVGLLGFSGWYPGWYPGPESYSRDTVDGALKDGSLWSRLVLGHQIGHNLWIVHDPVTRAAQNDEGKPFFAGGQGYRRSQPSFRYAVDDGSVSWWRTHQNVTCVDHPGPWSACTSNVVDKEKSLGTLMTYAPHFLVLSSSQYRRDGLRVGEPGLHEAASVARRIMPYLAAAQPAVVGDLNDYSCTGHCLGEGRFSVSVTFRDPKAGGVRGARKHDAFASDTGAVFYFFEPENPELLLKVVDACGVNGRHWVFGSAATDLEYWVRISDLATVRGVTYHSRSGGLITNDQGYSTMAGVISDTTGFPCNP